MSDQKICLQTGYPATPQIATFTKGGINLCLPNFLTIGEQLLDRQKSQ